MVWYIHSCTYPLMHTYTHTLYICLHKKSIQHVDFCYFPDFILVPWERKHVHLNDWEDSTLCISKQWIIKPCNEGDPSQAIYTSIIYLDLEHIYIMFHMTPKQCTWYTIRIISGCKKHLLINSFGISEKLASWKIMSSYLMLPVHWKTSLDHTFLLGTVFRLENVVF